MQLAHRVALVTGGSSGIGQATANLLARHGAFIGILGEKPEHVQKAADTINKAGGKAMPLVADVSVPEQMEKAVKELTDKTGRLDIVMANAGINGVWAPIEEIAPDEWHKTIETNLTGTFLTIKYAVPFLKKQGGSIIVTASVNGTRIFSNTGATAYSTSKAGQVAMTKMLALELAPSKIRVNVICPGAIKTNIDQSTEKRDLDKVQIEVDIKNNFPLESKPGSADQVAELALFLASDASSHITGTPIWIDGAESLIKG